MLPAVTPEILLLAYAQGYFPMAKSRDADELHWFSPEKRGVLPLETFHIPRSLRKFMRQHPYEITFDTAFPDVIRHCAEVRYKDRTDSWINEEIISLYCALFEMGFAHSIECYAQGRLAGGLYGVALGGAFFGESMFSLMPNASKIALVHLAERLKSRGYLLLDTQYVNRHLLQFGACEIDRKEYMCRLAEALSRSLAF